MNTNIDNFFIFFFMLLPLFLITGPAIPDIIITLSSLYFLLSYLLLKNNYIFLKDRLFIISVIFWISLIFVSFFAYNKIKSFQDSVIFIRILFIPIIGYFFFFNSEKRIKIIISIIFCCVCFVVFDTLFQYLNYDSKNGFGKDLLGFKSDWYGRLTGPFGDELIPGAYISKFGLLGYLYFIFQKKNKFTNYFEITYLSLIGFVCFGTGERMALASYFLALFFLFVFYSKKRLIFLISIIIIFISIFISTQLHPFYNDYKVISSTHYHQGLTVEKYYDCDLEVEKCKKILHLQPSFLKVLKNFNSSAYGEIYSVGLIMFKDNFLTGIGISNYQTACKNIQEYNQIMINYECAAHPHNIYIQWVAEGGIIVFISFIFLLSTFIFFMIKSKNSSYLKLIAIACMLILFWPIMSTGSLIKNWNGVLSFYIIAICISLCRVRLND